VDVPSGLNANNGKVFGVCIEAKKTVTFACPKVGLKGNEKYTGEVITANISIPKVLIEHQCS
jgi:NAD(P)H-hydrate repair Nnr-like enzyme with NAD(P)H-hydrate epimerase domain